MLAGNRYNPGVPNLTPCPRTPRAAISPEFRTSLGRVGLLVSVRDQCEAGAALQGGADVIDVKEPSRGALGRADAEVVARVVQQVQGLRPVTAAAGDWGEMTNNQLAAWASECRASIVKVGLDNRLSHSDLAGAKQLRGLLAGIAIAPVLYADRFAAAPPGGEFLRQLVDAFASEWLVIDTHDKQAGDLFDAWPPETVARVIRDARSLGVGVVLAGSLTEARLPQAVSLQPALVGVRGAVCDSGRTSSICAERIASVSRLVAREQAVV